MMSILDFGKIQTYPAPFAKWKLMLQWINSTKIFYEVLSHLAKSNIGIANGRQNEKTKQTKSIKTARARLLFMLRCMTKKDQ